jgi:hypothetical protein
VFTITTKKEILQAIRAYCLYCTGDNQAEIRFCTSSPDAPDHYHRCPLWVFRMGTDPKPNEVKQNQALLMNEKRKQYYEANGSELEFQ